MDRELRDIAQIVPNGMKSATPNRHWEGCLRPNRPRESTLRLRLSLIEEPLYYQASAIFPNAHTGVSFVGSHLMCGLRERRLSSVSGCRQDVLLDACKETEIRHSEFRV